MRLPTCGLSLTRRIVSGTRILDVSTGEGWSSTREARGAITSRFAQSPRQEEVLRVGNAAYGSVDAGRSWLAWHYDEQALRKTRPPALGAPASDPAIVLDLFRALAGAPPTSVSESYLFDPQGRSEPVLSIEMQAASVASRALPADIAYWQFLGTQLHSPIRMTFVRSHQSAVVDVALPIFDEDILKAQSEPGSPDTPLTGLHVELTAACSFRESRASDHVEAPMQGVTSS
jgi:hypothetical protein